MHLSETQKEIKDCLAENGTTPVRYLEKLGLLGENSVFAHVVHVDEGEAEILAKTKSVVVHNPASNMKLSSGVLKMSLLQEKGCRVMLGTDGTSSNNNLCMLDEMKLAALLAEGLLDYVAMDVKSSPEALVSLAKGKGCETVAFPLISFGEFGYPKDMALTVATTVIGNFLMDNEMTVYIVVFDKDAYQISEKLFYDVAEYIDDNYVSENEEPLSYKRQRRVFSRECFFDVKNVCFENFLVFCFANVLNGNGIFRFAEMSGGANGRLAPSRI